MTESNLEEVEILEAFESGKLHRTSDDDELLKRHREYATAMLQRDERIDVSLSSRDLRRLQKRALEEGIPPQTLAASIIHEYVEGTLHESS